MPLVKKFEPNLTKAHIMYPIQNKWQKVINMENTSQWKGPFVQVIFLKKYNGLPFYGRWPQKISNFHVRFHFTKVFRTMYFNTTACFVCILLTSLVQKSMKRNSKFEGPQFEQGWFVSSQFSQCYKTLTINFKSCQIQDFHVNIF